MSDSPKGISHPKRTDRLPHRCCRCNEIKECTEYQYDGAGDTPIRLYCFDCRKLEQEINEKKERVEKAKAMLSQLVDVSGGKKPTPKIQEIAAELVEKFGGAGEFAACWYEHVSIAMKNRPGSVGVLQHFVSMAKLIQAANQQDTDEDIAHMTREQLEAESRRLMLETLLDSLEKDTKSEAAKKILDLFQVKAIDVVGVELIQ